MRGPPAGKMSAFATAISSAAARPLARRPHLRMMDGICLWPVALFASIILLAAGATGWAEPLPEVDRSTIALALGYSSYFVDPHAAMNPSGIASEVRWGFGGQVYSVLSKAFCERHQLTFSMATVLRGGITTDAVALTYGRSYELEHLFLGIGFAPYTYVLFPRGDRTLAPGYALDGGPRFAAYGHLGWRPSVTEDLGMTIEVKYTFSVKNLYWHNPFVPHVHRDMFNSLVVGLGVRLGHH